MIDRPSDHDPSISPLTSASRDGHRRFPATGYIPLAPVDRDGAGFDVVVRSDSGSSECRYAWDRGTSGGDRRHDGPVSSLAAPLQTALVSPGPGTVGPAVHRPAAVFPTRGLGARVRRRTPHVTIALAEFFLCCQVLVLWRWRSTDPLPIAFSCLALVTLIFALNNTLPQGAESIYVLVVTMALLLPTLLAASPPKATRRNQPAIPWSARFVLLLVCGSVLLGTWTVSQVWSRWLPDAQTWFATQVGRTLVDQHRLQQYSTSGSLTAIRDEMAINPNRTALKVYSAERPGYLAGRVFDRVRTRPMENCHCGPRSTAISKRPQSNKILRPLESVPAALQSSDGRLSTFELSKLEDPSTARQMTIKNDPRRGRVFFTPLAWAYVQGSGEVLSVDEHDIIRSGISSRRPYVAFADATAPERSLSATATAAFGDTAVGIAVERHQFGERHLPENEYSSG